MSTSESLYEAVLTGKTNEIEPLVEQALDDGASASTLVQETLRPAMDEVGDRFLKGDFFCPT